MTSPLFDYPSPWQVDKSEVVRAAYELGRNAAAAGLDRQELAAMINANPRKALDAALAGWGIQATAMRVASELDLIVEKHAGRA